MSKRGVANGEEQGTKKARTEFGVYRDADGEERQEVRVLVDNSEAAVVIGKGGENVKNVRNATNTFVSIVKNNDNSKEQRVMQIRGTPENNAQALRQIAELLIVNTNSRKEEGDHVEQWTFKILIHKVLAGAIIGKGGEIIRATQAETGARVSLSTEPVGASTEKTCSVTGTPETLYAAISRILTSIAENPIKPGTHNVLFEPSAGPPPGAFAAPPGAYGAPQGYMPSPYGAPQGYMPQGPMGGMGGGRGGPPMGMGGPPPGQGGAQKSQKIVIPSVTAGMVIGKGGSIIRDIKIQSGANISIAAVEFEGATERVVTITGSEQGIQSAIFLIRQRVESFVQPEGY